MAKAFDALKAMIAKRFNAILSALEQFQDQTRLRRFETRLGEILGPKHRHVLDENYEVLWSRRGNQLLVLLQPSGEALSRSITGADNPHDLLDAVGARSIDRAFLIARDAAGQTFSFESRKLLSEFSGISKCARIWLERKKPKAHDAVEGRAVHESSQGFFDKLSTILANLDLIDFFANAEESLNVGGSILNTPFDEENTLPSFAYAKPREKSVLFLHNSYYHFNCVSAGLKARGWNAVTVSLEPPGSSQQKFFHGEDINLFDPDPMTMSHKLRQFLATVPEKFGSLHFYGQGMASFFPLNFENTDHPRVIPWDFLELRRHGMVIGYMPSGCLDGGLQSSIRELTGGLCRRCVWEQRHDVCSDARNLVWNKKLAALCDWVGFEGDLITPERVSPKSVYGPVVTALDPERWKPGIQVPDDMKIERNPGEVLVYHGVGNYKTRRLGDRDIKGTGAVMAAIEQLKTEGLPVRLIFAHDIESTRVRFLQTQADIVIDQLNYGRYGANARECMMLGKPTICYLDPKQAAPLPPLRPIQEVPMVSASEATVTDVLRELVLNPMRRAEIGARARNYAVEWHGQDACAGRYERVIERIKAGQAPETPDLYPV